MNQRVLVTGGAGFIGSHMAEALLARGCEVVVLDNESTGLRQNVPAGATFIHGDVRDPQALEEAFAPGLDAVFHIAGQASTIRSFGEPLADLGINVEGTINVVSKCLEHRVPRLLFASSMTAYGHPEQVPVPESTPCVPISYYGITKYAAERYVHSTAARHDLDFPFNVTSFRMFNVYGERQRLDNPYQGVMGIFIGNVLREETIRIFGDGLQSRDFVHIDDVVRAWLAAWTTPEAYGQVINLGTGSNRSINELVDAVLAANGLSRDSYPVEYGEPRPGDQRHMSADISRARQLLGWQPQVTLAEGIARTLRWAAAEVAATPERTTG